MEFKRNVPVYILYYVEGTRYTSLFVVSCGFEMNTHPLPILSHYEVFLHLPVQTFFSATNIILIRLCQNLLQYLFLVIL